MAFKNLWARCRTLGALAFSLSVAQAGAAVQYRVTDEHHLSVTLNGRPVVTVDFQKGTPAALFRAAPGETFPRLNVGDSVMLEAVADLDRNGTPDALIATVDPTANGGLPMYTVVTYAGGRVQVAAGVPGWETAVLETLAGRPVIRIRHEAEGAQVLYAYQGGKLSVAAKQTIPELFAQPSVRGADFRQDDRDRVFRVNLGGSSAAETMTCAYWSRWAMVRCGVQDAQGRTLLPDDVGCSRFGVLSTRTHGYLDLVCDADKVVRWNGARYVLPDR
ncbi:hypothetical protein [Deinococcus maricopensis]|uniref:Uncharacterized protein n=1 Tax=Deinococcus maricopensis (strain DSM 21211 / LMG 22137 / NRRL B-23946 / LB-34) TaxID=709986 RepID=E8U363_DEIML|nr:hypothetical protein [Deinococcus maricopensis]ADV66008.1 hypothetical protein Deima_0347 [Deinococcus maricopensis DSM 21211]